MTSYILVTAEAHGQLTTSGFFIGKHRIGEHGVSFQMESGFLLCQEVVIL